ncbi:MAG TPA: hypothetical protein PK894_07210 [Defluviitoga sp.]|nr:hypothetical protein [Defluviitoga sp.]HPZ29534.1 hypothetical protein [Defluviitoga sp.]HQD63366.1 hypothetical protein [Defluviitoga sp.]
MKENKIEQKIEEKLNESEKEEFGSWKNLLIIIIAMAVIYTIALLLWNVYSGYLENRHYYPYIKMKDTGYKKVTKFPYSPKGTNITINKTSFSNIYSVETHFGSFFVQTFDNRFFFFESPETIVVSYPSYDFRGMEYSVLNNYGDFFRFVIVPSEELVPEVFDFVTNLSKIKILNSSDLLKFQFLSKNNEAYVVKTKYEEFHLPKDFIEIIGESEEFVYLVSKKYGLFNKIYYVKKDASKFGELIIISGTGFPIHTVE